MDHTFLLTRVVAVAVIMLTASPSATGTPIESGLQAYYTFSGNTSDQSGNNLALTLSGASLTTDRFGKANQALGFADNVSFAAFDYSIANSSFSIGGWWYQPTVTDPITAAGGFAQGDVGAPGQAFRLMTDYTPAGLRFSFWFDDFDLYFDRDQSQWLHIFATFDLTTLERALYLNGQLVSTNLAAYGFSGTGPMRFGFMPGAMDEIRVYDRVLSANEVGRIYSRESRAAPETAPTGAMMCLTLLAVLVASRRWASQLL